jgi:hypothetical protein
MLMAKRKGWRNRKRPAVIREERWGPTPETLAKIQPDPLALLLDSDEARECLCGKTRLESAAEEIRAVYMAVTRTVMCKLPSANGGGGRSPEIPDALAWAHLHTYMPWANHWGHSRVLEAVIDVVVDRYQSPPAARASIVTALADYAKRMRERAVSN